MAGARAGARGVPRGIVNDVSEDAKAEREEGTPDVLAADVEPDSAPQAAAESHPGAPVPARSPRWKALGKALATRFGPVVLAAGAVGMHWRLNVPEHIEHSPKDQGAAKGKDKNAAKRRAARERFSARDQVRLDREWRRWKSQAFEGEPVRGPWSRKFQAVISKAVVVARREAFEKAPEEPRVIVTGTECRTVRCRFILRSPFEHELRVLDEALERLVDHNGSIWRTYESGPIAAPADAPKDNFHYEVTISFASDEVDSRGFEVGPPIEAEGGPRQRAGEETGDAAGPAGAAAPPDAAGSDDEGGVEDDEPEGERGGGESND